MKDRFQLVKDIKGDNEKNLYALSVISLIWYFWYPNTCHRCGSNDDKIFQEK